MTPDEWDDPKLWDVPDRDVRWPAERWHCEAVAVGMERAGVCSPSNPCHNPPCGPIPAERCPGSGRLPTGAQGDDRSQWWACPVCGRPVDVAQHVDEGGIPTEFLLVKEHTR